MCLLKIFIKTFLLLLLCRNAYAQDFTPAADTIVKHVKWYSQKKGTASLFAHLDKSVYVNNDIIWFAAYMLGTEAADVAKHQVLSASLVNSNDQTIAVQGKFIMQGGMACGQLTVPDSVAPGHYAFMAATNRLINGKPAIVFTQAVTVKSAEIPAFNLELTLDTLYKDPVNMRVLIQAGTKSKPLDGAAVSYYLGKDKGTRIAGKAKTSLLGSYVLLIPKDHINPAQHNLEVQVKYHKEVKVLNLSIPVKKETIDVKFYPEGGHLISGLSNRVGWEVKTPAGTAIKTSGILYMNDIPADTIETDSYGMGYFTLAPRANARYAVKLLPGITAGVTYALPEALSNGTTVLMRNAIVGDTVTLLLQTSYKSRLSVIVHNYKQVFSSKEFTASAQGRSLKVDLTGVPRGINAITVLDSLQRPVAERLFFAHYNQKPSVSMQLDNNEPGLRQKIHVKLKLNGINGIADKGVMSVACVQDNRFEVKNDNNIEHYFYLQNELDNLPLKDDLTGTTEVDRHYLNELLLVRGWRKYNWADMVQTFPADTLIKEDSLIFGGSVTHFMSPLKKPAQMILMRDSLVSVNMIATNSNGHFTIANTDMYSQPEKKVRLIVSGRSDEYVINVDDPYVTATKNLAKFIEPVLFEEPLAQTTTAFVLNGFEHATKLREVKITANNNKFLHGFGANVNACGDYVCLYHILNCPNHVNDSRNRAPYRGEMVQQPGIGLVAYTGCAVNDLKAGMLSFTGIYTAKEFYGADYAQINPTEPDYLSTICWKHGVILNSDKETEISFYTSDITGKFRIVVQGITNSDVVYGEQSFNVRKKTP